MDLRVAGRMGTVFANIPRAQLINHTVANKEAIVTETGCLATWTPLHSTGRVPENTVIVQRDENLPRSIGARRTISPLAHLNLTAAGNKPWCY
jgi:ATP-dependent phosphoenolpyruvate carboxykinase